MSDFGDTGGVAGLRGYRYQSWVALYFLTVKEAREVEWEADGEDVTIINEDPDRKSIEYIQAKFRDDGSFSLNEFRKSVLPQFWLAYSNALKNHPEKYIKCTLITSVAWEHDLKVFIEACKMLRNRGFSLHEFEKLITTIKSKYDSIKKGRDPEEFRRFLFGLDIRQPFTCKQIELEIISYLKSCGIIEVRSKIRQMLQLIVENDQGVITRRQIEDISGKALSPITDSKCEPLFTVRDVNTILGTLKTAKEKYGTSCEMPDKEKLFRDIIRPAESASKVLMSCLSKDAGNITVSPDRDEFKEVLISDVQKVREDADTIANLEVQLWTSRTRYTQRIESIKKIADYVKSDNMTEDS